MRVCVSKCACERLSMCCKCESECEFIHILPRAFSVSLRTRKTNYRTSCLCVIHRLTCLPIWWTGTKKVTSKSTHVTMRSKIGRLVIEFHYHSTYCPFESYTYSKLCKGDEKKKHNNLPTATTIIVADYKKSNSI